MEDDKLGDETFQPVQQPDLIEEINHLPVNQLISDFNRKSFLGKLNTDKSEFDLAELKNTSLETENKPKPKPLPRVKKPNRLLIEKPVPSPRNFIKSRSLEDITSLTKEKENNTKSNYQDSPTLHHKPIPKPKPVKLNRETLNIKEGDKNSNDIENDKLAQKEIVTSTENLIDLSENIEDNMNKKEIDYNSITPYEIVPIHSPTTSTSYVNMSDESYLEPIDLSFRNKNTFSMTSDSYNISLIPTTSLSSPGKISLPVPLHSPTTSTSYVNMSDESYLEPIDSKPKSPRDKSPSSSRKLKPKKQRVMKGKSVTYSKSVVEEDSSRRKSTPTVIYGCNQNGDSPEPLYGSMGDNHNSDDDEGWASDEFDDSCDENDYEKDNETYIIPKSHPHFSHFNIVS